jgi:hypothetical protein
LLDRLTHHVHEELRTRVDFHVTGYYRRRASTKVRSGEVTVDGKPVLQLSYDRFCRESDGWFASVRRGQKLWGMWASASSAETVWSEHQTDEIHPPQQLGDAMRAYLAMPIDEALLSANPFIRALAIIDRRVGKRRLERLEVGERPFSCARILSSSNASVGLGKQLASQDRSAPPRAVRAQSRPGPRFTKGPFRDSLVQSRSPRTQCLCITERLSLVYNVRRSPAERRVQR